MHYLTSFVFTSTPLTFESGEFVRDFLMHSLTGFVFTSTPLTFESGEFVWDFLMHSLTGFVHPLHSLSSACLLGEYLQVYCEKVGSQNCSSNSRVAFGKLAPNSSEVTWQQWPVGEILLM